MSVKPQSWIGYIKNKCYLFEGQLTSDRFSFFTVTYILRWCDHFNHCWCDHFMSLYICQQCQLSLSHSLAMKEQTCLIWSYQGSVLPLWMTTHKWQIFIFHSDFYTKVIWSFQSLLMWSFHLLINLPELPVKPQSRSSQHGYNHVIWQCLYDDLSPSGGAFRDILIFNCHISVALSILILWPNGNISYRPSIADMIQNLTLTGQKDRSDEL